jgi:hypothetical protein
VVAGLSAKYTSDSDRQYLPDADPGFDVVYAIRSQSAMRWCLLDYHGLAAAIWRAIFVRPSCTRRMQAPFRLPPGCAGEPAVQPGDAQKLDERRARRGHPELMVALLGVKGYLQQGAQARASQKPSAVRSTMTGPWWRSMTWVT